MDAVTTVPLPVNEPIRSYAPGSAERAGLEAALKDLASSTREFPMVVGGVRRSGEGPRVDVVQPHRHAAVLGTLANASDADVAAAVQAAKDAAPAWRALPYDERAAVFLRAADLLAGPWRDRLNAATMLGQSKTAIQAEIDAACEFIDFLRFNVAFGRQILAEQPVSSPGVWNRLDHRPLEGFVLAITPFNFTAIAGNLPCAPALMGNTVVWKPSPTQQLAASLTLELLEAAGPAPGRDQHGDRGRPGRLAGRADRPRPRRHPLHRLDRRPSRGCGATSGRTSPGTARTRASSARPAARTSSSRTPRPTSRS